MPRTISPDRPPAPSDIASAEPTPTQNDEEIAIEVDLADILADDDVETTTRIPIDKAQKLVDAAFGAAP